MYILCYSLTPLPFCLLTANKLEAFLKFCKDDCMDNYIIISNFISGGHFTKLPYRNIAMLVIGLVVPLSVGLFIKWKSERVALILKRLLKPISVIFIIFIMTFGVYAHLYIFAFFDWKVCDFLKYNSEVLIWIGTCLFIIYSLRYNIYSKPSF